MTQDQVLGIVRHVLTTFGGLIVSRGYTDESTMTSLVGAAITIIGVIWSIKSKTTDGGSK